LSDYVIDIEQAAIAQVGAAKRADGTTDFFNAVAAFPGQKGEEFLELTRRTAPSCYFRLDRALNRAKQFETATSLGKPFSQGAYENRETLVWSVFICARSLRAVQEQTLGGPGVIGAYDIMTLLIGPPNSPASTPGQLRGFKPAAVAEPFIYVGRELLGQTTAACVYELQFMTRVQL
jgi:hypothetical protein